MSFALGVFMLSLSASATLCKIVVTDDSNGWPVPLVQLVEESGRVWVTDNAGVIALDEPDLFGRAVRFKTIGHGYELGLNNAIELKAEDGATLRLKAHRLLRAKRLGRITGCGFFAESMKCGGLRRPWEDGSTGRDSVQCVPWKNGLFWLWGDTDMRDYALGFFNVSAATTPNPPFRGRYVPPIVPVYTPMTNANGRLRGVIKPFGSGPIWIFGLVSLKDAAGAEHLCGSWSQIKEFCTPDSQGLCEWDESEQMFKNVRTLWDSKDGPRPERPIPDQNNVRWTDPEGRGWVLFGAPSPVLQIPDSFEAWKDPSTWRVLKPSRMIAKKTGGEVRAVNGQTVWNASVGKWISIFAEHLGFGRIWVAEADSPFGPWRNAELIVRHDNYTFYNPIIHAEVGADKPFIVFEATYTASFSNPPFKTPRYDYNQVLYRLDLKPTEDARVRTIARLDPAAKRPEPFRLRIVEKGTSNPVTNATLRTTDKQVFHPSAEGVVTIRSPELMGHKTYFHFECDEFGPQKDFLGNTGFAVTPEPGKTETRELPRRSSAGGSCFP